MKDEGAADKMSKLDSHMLLLIQYPCYIYIA